MTEQTSQSKQLQELSKIKSKKETITVGDATLEIKKFDIDSAEILGDNMEIIENAANSETFGSKEIQAIKKIVAHSLCVSEEEVGQIDFQFMIELFQKISEINNPEDIISTAPENNERMKRFIEKKKEMIEKQKGKDEPDSDAERTSA